jgi:uncharacterized BrkB/YihY/UPF0761 family membrane protein
MPAFVERLIDRVLRLPIVKLALAIFDRYNGAGGGLLANGLAFATLFAAVPTVLLALGLMGFLIDDPTYQAKLLDVLSEAFPPLAPLFDELLAAVTAGSGITSLLGAVGLVWAISQFYATLDFAMARLFPGIVERDIVRRTLRGFGVVGILLAGVLGLVVLAWVSSLLDTLIPDAFPLATTIRNVLTSPIAFLAVAILVLAVAYRVLPPKRPSIGDLGPVAIVAGIAVFLLTQVFTFLAPRLVGATAFVGSLAAAFVALAWLSFSFQAILLGAAWVAIRMSSHTVPVSGTIRADDATTASGEPRVDREADDVGRRP